MVLGSNGIMNNVSTVLFDLDGTLRLSDPPSIDTFHQYAHELGIPLDSERQRDARRWVSAYWANSTELLEDIESFGNHPENGAFWTNHARKHLLNLGGTTEQAEALAPRITQYMLDRYEPKGIVAEGALDVLDNLRANGYRMGVVSNRQAPIGDEITVLGLGSYFEITLAAGEVELWKPDPRLLEHAAGLMGITCEGTLYVGDNYHADVIAAEAAGMQPILIDPLELFPEARCPVIHDIRGLLDLLG